jgi:hypothetical protein
MTINRRRRILVALLLLAVALPASAQFGKNKITYMDFDWKVYESPHFDIHYYPEMEPFLEEIVSYAESAYLEISQALDHELRFRVPMVVYRTHGEFEQTNITLSMVPEGVGAFAEPIQNRMVLPIDLPPDKLYQLIAHELVHIFEYSLLYDGYLGRALRSNPPTWLMEGLASYLADDEDNLDRMAIRDAVVNGTLPTLEQLNIVTFMTYRYGHAIFDFIEQEHGKEGLRSFLFEYRKVLLNNNIEKAVKESFGYDLSTFNRNFNRFLRRKYYPVLLEKKSPDDYGEEIGIKKRGRYTFSPTISPSGELVAALGTPGMELDLIVLSVEGGKKVKNLTKGFTNRYSHLVADVFEGKRDLSWSPVADHVAVFARRENTWPLLIFNAVNGKRLHQIVPDDIVQCASPAFSPDGKRVAFEGNRNGVVDIFEIDLETREIRNLTQDDFTDANPWYADDGATLVYNRRLGPHWKIFTVDLSDSEKKAQLTFGHSSDIQPSFARDGETIYFSSDRGEHGIFNLYALDLGSAEVHQYTDVVGGTFAPVEMSERSGQRNLVFGAYFNGTFRLYRMPLKAPEATISSEARFDDPLDAEPFEPPLSLRVDEPQKRDYKLKWDIDPPAFSVGVTDDGTFLGDAAISFSDLMGNHRISIVTSTVDEYSNTNVVYANLKRRFTWGGQLIDFRDYFLRQNANGTITRDRGTRLTGVSGFLYYPFSQNYRVETALGAMEIAADQVFAPVNPGEPFGFSRATDRFATANVAFTGDTARGYGFTTLHGKRLRIGTYYAKHLSGDREGDIIEHRLDFRAYRKLTRRSLIAFRVRSIYNTGDNQLNYGLGGINELRGYRYRDFVGSRMMNANVELRFPLIDLVAFPWLAIFEVRGMLFFDVGAAWFEDDLWYDPRREIVRVDDPGLYPFGPVVDATPIRYEFWNSELDELQDGRASYGAGFQFLLFGWLPMNWVWARPLDYVEWDPNALGAGAGGFVRVEGKTVQEFYITYDW